MLKTFFPYLNRPPRWLLIALLALIPFFLFAKIQNYEFINLDDDRYVYENSDIRKLSLENLKKYFTRTYVSSYAPLPMISYALDYALYQNNPGGYHRTNLIFHIANTLLVFALFNFFFPNRTVCFLGALLFAIHPVQVESVAWVSERKNLLFCFFTLIGINLLLYRSQSHKSGFGKWAGPIIAWTGAILSKINAITVPFILGALGYFEPRLAIPRKRFLFLLLCATALGALGFVFIVYPATVHHFHKNNFFLISLQQFPTMGLYLKHYFAPFSLGIFYDFNASHFRTWEESLVAFIPALCLWTALVFAFLKRASWGFWLFWFVISLAPMTSFFPVMVNDRHLYFACIGLIGCFLTAWNYRPRLIAGILIFLILASFILTPSQISIWRNNASLWEQTLKRYPGHDRAMIQLAHALISVGDIRQAEILYLRALSIKPRETKYLLSLGNLYLKSGQTQKVRDFITDIQTNSPGHPGISILETGLALANGEAENALRLAEEAVRRNPRNPIAYKYLALASLQSDHFEAARENFSKAALFGDSSPENLFQAALTWSGSGQWEKMYAALKNMEESDLLLPGIFFQMGYASLKLNNPVQAEYYYQKSIRLQPAIHPAFDHLGLLALEDSRPEDAVKYFQSALQLAPDSELYRRHLQTAQRQLSENESL